MSDSSSSEAALVSVAEDVDRVDTGSPAPEDVDLDNPEYFTNRELSLLDFQSRVLEMGLKHDVPLLERVKFLAIVSSNLDEFFMVRVAGLIEQRMAGTNSPGADGLSVGRLLAEIRERVTAINTTQREAWHEDIRPKLAAAGVEFVSYSSLSESEKQDLQGVFEREMYPVLTPQAVDEARPFPHISGFSLNMLIVVEDELGEHVARLKIPPVIRRYVQVPSSEEPGTNPFEHFRFVLVDEMIEANLEQLFPGKRDQERHMFRLTRAADYELRDSTAETIMQAVEAELEQQLFGFVVRLCVEPAMPDEWRDWLRQPNSTCRQRNLRHGPAAGFCFPDGIDRDRSPGPEVSRASPRGCRSGTRTRRSIFDVLQRRDILLHHPYDAFSPVVDLVRQASTTRMWSRSSKRSTALVALHRSLTRCSRRGTTRSRSRCSSN